MNIDILVALIALIVGLLTNFIIFVVFLSKLSSRIETCEKDILESKKIDIKMKEELKSLHKIEGQLEILISHILPKK